MKWNEVEWIGIGIMVAIGFYIAPAVVMGISVVFVVIGAGICRLFGGCK